MTRAYEYESFNCKRYLCLISYQRVINRRVWTEEAARLECENQISESDFNEQCSKLENVDILSPVENCVSDILVNLFIIYLLYLTIIVSLSEDMQFYNLDEGKLQQLVGVKGYKMHLVN